MANGVYTSAKDEILSRDLTAATLKIVLIDLADYTYSAAHDTLADIPSAARVATSGALSGLTASGGVLDAADPTIAGVTGDPIEAYAVYFDDGSGEANPLLCFIDTESDGTTPISFTPNGSGVTVTMPNGIISL